MREIWHEVSLGEMPLWYSLPLHRDAKLQEADISILKTWLKPEGMPLESGPEGKTSEGTSAEGTPTDGTSTEGTSGADDD